MIEMSGGVTGLAVQVIARQLDDSDTPFSWRPSLDKSRWEVVRRTNEDWRTTIDTTDVISVHRVMDEAIAAWRLLANEYRANGIIKALAAAELVIAEAHNER